MADQVACKVRECACPGEPHPDGDIVYLLPTLNMEGGVEAEAALLRSLSLYPLAEKATTAEINAVAAQRTDYLRGRWLTTFLRHGAVGWNLVDADGEPVPFDVDALMADWSLARNAADQANDLYSDSVLAPFRNPPPKQSRTGRTAGGTRPPSTPTPMRSKSSSPRASVDGESLTA